MSALFSVISLGLMLIMYRLLCLVPVSIVSLFLLMVTVLFLNVVV